MQVISEITINIDPTIVGLAFVQITWHGLGREPHGGVAS